MSPPSTHPQSSLSESEPGSCLFVVGLLSWLSCKPQWFSCLQFPIGLELKSHAQLFHMGPGDLNLLPLSTESFPQPTATFGISNVRHTLPSKSAGKHCFNWVVFSHLQGSNFLDSVRWVILFLCFRYLQQRFQKSWDVLTTKSRTRTHTESFHFKLIGFSKIFYHSVLVFCFFKSQEWVTALTGHSFLVFLWLFYLNMDGHGHFKSVFLVYWS